MKNKNRVVITGIGITSSIGEDLDSFWTNLQNGISGISRVEMFDVSAFNSKIGGEIKKFTPSKHIKFLSYKKYGRASQFAICAAKQALADAGIESVKLRKDVAVFIGTTMGEAQAIEQIDKAWVHFGEDAVWPKSIWQYPSNSISMNVAREFGLYGKSLVIPTACSAGNYAIGYAYDLIKLGKISIAICGGADAFSRIAFTGFNRIFAMADNQCQPFDKNRKGMLLGEGAGFLVLESLQSAQQRKAKIYAEIVGYGLSCDANHMTIPNEDGVYNVMRKALESASICKEEVDHICAHGTGTPANDKTEALAINRLFQDHTASIAVNSIKSMLGHTMGAASAIESISCVLSIHHSIVPPTINFSVSDENCKVTINTKKIERPVNVALNNSFAFGGNNACLVFKKYEN